MLGHVGTSTPGHFDDTSRFTSDDALRRWQPPFGWPHASSSLVEGRGIPKTARDLLYHKTAREWRVHPIMKLETYFYNLENLNHQFSINMKQGRGNLTATQGISFRARAQKTGEARWPKWTGLLIGLLTTTPVSHLQKKKDKTKCSSLPAIATAFIMILICRLIFDLKYVLLLALLFQMLIYVPIAHPSFANFQHARCQWHFGSIFRDPTCMSNSLDVASYPLNPTTMKLLISISWLWTILKTFAGVGLFMYTSRLTFVIIDSECRDYGGVWMHNSIWAAQLLGHCQNC